MKNEELNIKNLTQDGNTTKKQQTKSLLLVKIR